MNPIRERIMASAGTGKTFTLAGRFLKLLFQEVPPAEILATTFTRKAAGEILAAELVSPQPADDSPDAGNQDVPPTSPLLTLVTELSEARRLGDEHAQIIQRSLGQVLELTIEVERVAATYRSSIDASHRQGKTITGTIAGSRQSVELLTLNESHIGGLVRGEQWQGFAVVSDWDALYQRLRMLESPRS